MFQISWSNSYSKGQALVLATSAEEAVKKLVESRPDMHDEISYVDDVEDGIAVITTDEAEDYPHD